MKARFIPFEIGCHVPNIFNRSDRYGLAGFPTSETQKKARCEQTKRFDGGSGAKKKKTVRVLGRARRHCAARGGDQSEEGKSKTQESSQTQSRGTKWCYQQKKTGRRKKKQKFNSQKTASFRECSIGVAWKIQSKSTASAGPSES